MSSRGSSPYRMYKPSSLNGSLPTGALGSGSSSSVGYGYGYGYAARGNPRGRSVTPTRPSSPASFARNFSSLTDSVSPVTHQRVKENVCVTVRFRPLSYREIQRGDEVAWYADGDTTVCSEYSPVTSYAFDRVFGPATTTRAVYDTAARHVVRGAMEGLNGTVFAYGVTSSGKTHTMHGDQKSPGIISLAIKDVFSIIQDTPGREFLLRVSYLEIYNEVINDLLDPAGQNLRVREDYQGTYVEALKEEVVLSPAHALSLIAAGEEHRHVGSNNFNLLSSRSHTIFTLTIESSSRGADYDNDEISLSQLNLIDLAGSESSKTETTGLRRKEGSYINKSLLTLGTVIAKLSEGKASHIPYRDSKLTRLIQSSLSGHGRISLICTVTPASSNAEETHNTLKFAQRAKRVEIHAAPNRIMDEKSLIKRYQKEVTILKRELDQLKRGILDRPLLAGTTQEDLITLRHQLEAGQVKMQSRLEEEEQAKAALLGRIQRLTKLILVSTKNSIPVSVPERPTHGRRRSFGDEISYLSERRRALELEEDEDSSLTVQDFDTPAEVKEDNNGMLPWFKLKRKEDLHGSATSLDPAYSPNTSTPSISSTGIQFDLAHELKGGRRISFSRKCDEFSPTIDSFPECTQAGELFSATVRGRRPPPTGETMADQMELLREQVKMLAGEVALSTSTLKRLSEQAAANQDDAQLQAQIQKTKDEIQEKKQQIRVLEQRIISVGEAALNNASPLEMSQTISKLMSQLNEKEFDLEIKSADNRILQEQLQQKIVENNKLQESLASLKEQRVPRNGKVLGDFDGSDNESSISNGAAKAFAIDSGLQSQLLMQAAEIEILKQEQVDMAEQKEGLQIQCQKLAEEACYAKELASAAAVELKKLAEEVTKLSFHNTKLGNDLAKAQELLAIKAGAANGYPKHRNGNGNDPTHAKPDFFMLGRMGCETENGFCDDIDSWQLDPEDLKRELYARKEREASLESALADKEQLEAELQKKLEEAKHREADLENDLAGMWVLVAQLKRDRDTATAFLKTKTDNKPLAESNASTNIDETDKETQSYGIAKEIKEEYNKAIEALKGSLEEERNRATELELFVSHLKGEELDALSVPALEDLQSLHIEALTKLCQAKARMQEDKQLKDPNQGSIVSMDHHDDERISHICKVCFEAPTAAVLLPCRHFCLCKPCAVACTECPLCRSGIADRIITFTS